jgi:Zn-dependent protease with chaperone function
MIVMLMRRCKILLCDCLYTEREAERYANGVLLGFWIPGVHWMDRCISKRRCGYITDKGMINFKKKEPLIGTSCAYSRYMYILLHLYCTNGWWFSMQVYVMVGGFVYFAVFGNGYHSTFQRKAAQCAILKCIK